jgi:hypothetical protein
MISVAIRGVRGRSLIGFYANKWDEAVSMIAQAEKILLS